MNLKSSILIITTVILIIFPCSCQKTPKNPIVVNKNIDIMIDMAVSSDAVSHSLSLIERLEAPDRFSIDGPLIDAGKSLTVNIDGMYRYLAHQVCLPPLYQSAFSQIMR